MGFKEDHTSEEIGTAFALVFAAGGASCIGASAVFFPSILELANKDRLAMVCGLVVGAMLYISLVDIYGKATDGFAEDGHTDEESFIYATLCFFFGIGVSWGLQQVSRKMMGVELDEQFDYFDNEKFMSKTPVEAVPVKEEKDTTPEEIMDDTPDNRVSKLVNKLKQASEDEDEKDEKEKSLKDLEQSNTGDETNALEIHEDDVQKSLQNMGFEVAISMAIHNFPEGLLTFIGYMADPAVGIILAIGIGMHNIPEGLGVAVPIYYATGSRWKGFLWAFFSGATEPLGALFGYLIIRENISGNMYGFLFGTVAGIMTFISIDELMPTACRYDPENKYVTLSAICGMAAIAGSLCLFGVHALANAEDDDA